MPDEQDEEVLCKTAGVCDQYLTGCPNCIRKHPREEHERNSKLDNVGRFNSPVNDEHLHSLSG